MTRSAFVENDKTCEVQKLALIWLKKSACAFNLWEDLGTNKCIQINVFNKFEQQQSQVFSICSISIGHCVQGGVYTQ